MLQIDYIDQMMLKLFCNQVFWYESNLIFAIYMRRYGRHFKTLPESVNH